MTKILLVEDNEMNRDMLSRRLKRRGFEVIIAVDGAIGVSLAQSEQPDLILMDMSLPVLDGWEATKKIKAMPQTASIPVIALTAHAMVGDREKTLQAGCDDYDTKPVELKRLLKKIEILLDAVLQKSVTPPVKEAVPLETETLPVKESALLENGTLPVKESAPLETETPVVIPVSKPVSTPESANVSLPKPNNGENSILVVDDNEMNREVLGRRLSKVGYDVRFADSGEAALEQLEKESISLVLLDVMMPGIGGWETLRRIRLTSTASELPVIMVTAKNQSEDVVKAFGLGANDYITKPIDFPITLARVQSQLQLLRPSPPSQSVAPSPDKNPIHQTDDPLSQDTLNGLKDPAMLGSNHKPEPQIEKQDSSFFQVIAHDHAMGESQSNSPVLLNNQYKIFEQIQKTRFHQTFLAYDTHQTEKTVVSIQRISLAFSTLSPLIQSKIQAEINRFGLIFTGESSNMIRLFNAFAQGDYIYLVQEYVEGSLLSAEIQSSRTHTPLYSINVLGRLLEILSVVHRNNASLQYFSTISFTRRKRDGEIILTDFGISERLKYIVAQHDETSGVETGPPSLPSSIDFAEDLYLVGCITIQALIGQYPKRYDGAYAKRRLAWQTVEVNSKCAAFINRLIYPQDPSERFADATQAHRELMRSHLLLHAVKQSMTQNGKLM